MSQLNNNLITGDTFSIPDDMVAGARRFLGLDVAPETVEWDDEYTAQVEADYPEISIEQAMTLMYKNLHIEWGMSVSASFPGYSGPGPGYPSFSETSVSADASKVNGLPLFSTAAYSESDVGNVESVGPFPPFEKSAYSHRVTSLAVGNETYYDGEAITADYFEEKKLSTGIMEPPRQSLTIASASYHFSDSSLDNYALDTEEGLLQWVAEYGYGLTVSSGVGLLRNPKNDKFYLTATARIYSSYGVYDYDVSQPFFSFSISLDGGSDEARTKTPTEIAISPSAAHAGWLTVIIPSPSPKEYRFPIYGDGGTGDFLTNPINITFQTKDARIGNENW